MRDACKLKSGSVVRHKTIIHSNLPMVLADFFPHQCSESTAQMQDTITVVTTHSFSTSVFQEGCADVNHSCCATSACGCVLHHPSNPTVARLQHSQMLLSEVSHTVSAPVSSDREEGRSGSWDRDGKLKFFVGKSISLWTKGKSSLWSREVTRSSS